MFGHLCKSPKPLDNKAVAAFPQSGRYCQRRKRSANSRDRRVMRGLPLVSVLALTLIVVGKSV